MLLPELPEGWSTKSHLFVREATDAPLHRVTALVPSSSTEYRTKCGINVHTRSTTHSSFVYATIGYAMQFIDYPEAPTCMRCLTKEMVYLDTLRSEALGG